MTTPHLPTRHHQYEPIHEAALPDGVEWGPFTADADSGCQIAWGRHPLPGMVALTPPALGCPWLMLVNGATGRTSLFQLVETD